MTRFNKLLLKPTTMILEGKARKLTIVIQETEKVYQRSLYEAIVFAAKKYTMAGSTVTRGFMGYGADGLNDTSKTFEVSSVPPIIIEIIDREERIEDFANVVAGLLNKADADGIIYIEDVDIVAYRKHENVKTV
jgi:PII-like signaling protein